MYSTLYFKCVIFTKPDTAAFEKDIRILPKVNKVFGILEKNLYSIDVWESSKINDYTEKGRGSEYNIMFILWP